MHLQSENYPCIKNKLCRNEILFAGVKLKLTNTGVKEEDAGIR
jgi:hypothetical protein